MSTSKDSRIQDSKKNKQPKLASNKTNIPLDPPDRGKPDRGWPNGTRKT